MVAAACEDPSDGEPFVDRLPTPAARDCFAAWLAARRSDGPPALHDFAPHRLPPAVLPWVMLQRRLADGSIIYGLAGEELTRWFGENPKGRLVLANAVPDERERRLALVRRSMSEGLPVWIAGRTLFENREHVDVGRLGLPARDAGDQVLVVVYFLVGRRPRPDLRLVGNPSFEPEQVLWCTPEDLVRTRSPG